MGTANFFSRIIDYNCSFLLVPSVTKTHSFRLFFGDFAHWRFCWLAGWM